MSKRPIMRGMRIVSNGGPYRGTLVDWYERAPGSDDYTYRIRWDDSPVETPAEHSRTAFKPLSVKETFREGLERAERALEVDSEWSRERLFQAIEEAYAATRTALRAGCQR